MLHNLVIIYNVVQELWPFPLIEHGQTYSHSDYSAHLRAVQLWCIVIWEVKVHTECVSRVELFSITTAIAKCIKCDGIRSPI